MANWKGPNNNSGSYHSITASPCAARCTNVRKHTFLELLTLLRTTRSTNGYRPRLWAALVMLLLPTLSCVTLSWCCPTGAGGLELPPRGGTGRLCAGAGGDRRADACGAWRPGCGGGAACRTGDCCRRAAGGGCCAPLREALLGADDPCAFLPAAGCGCAPTPPCGACVTFRPAPLLSVVVSLLVSPLLAPPPDTPLLLLGICGGGQLNGG